MEYCPCGSLGSVSRYYRFSEVELFQIAKGCLLGLSYLHSHNIIHGVSE